MSYAFSKTPRFVWKNRTDKASFLGCFFTLDANHAQNPFISPLTSGAAGHVRTIDGSNINYGIKKKLLYLLLFFSLISNMFSPQKKTIFLFNLKYLFCHPFYGPLNSAARGGLATRPTPATPLLPRSAPDTLLSYKRCLTIYSASANFSQTTV